MRRRVDRIAAAPGAGPRPSRPERAAYASPGLPRGRAPRPITVPIRADDGARPGPAAGKGAGQREPASQLRPRGRTAQALPR